MTYELTTDPVLAEKTMRDAISDSILKYKPAHFIIPDGLKLSNSLIIDCHGQAVDLKFSSSRQGIVYNGKPQTFFLDLVNCKGGSVKGLVTTLGASLTGGLRFRGDSTSGCTASHIWTTIPQGPVNCIGLMEGGKGSNDVNNIVWNNCVTKWGGKMTDDSAMIQSVCQAGHVGLQVIGGNTVGGSSNNFTGYYLKYGISHQPNVAWGETQGGGNAKSHNDVIMSRCGTGFLLDGSASIGGRIEKSGAGFVIGNPLNAGRGTGVISANLVLATMLPTWNKSNGITAQDGLLNAVMGCYTVDALLNLYGTASASLCTALYYAVGSNAGPKGVVSLRGLYDTTKGLVDATAVSSV